MAFIGVEQGVALEVLDWGGSGRPLILLAGLNNTAHVFDSFAANFTDRFHVIGITRRGFGASSRAESGYEIATLAHDVLMTCDRLHLDHVILVGHSIAGDELTTFAASYPTRVSALVYLDAAYDRTTEPRAMKAPEQPMTSADAASFGALNARFARVFGWRLPEDELRAQTVVDSHNTPLRSTLSPEVAAQVLESVETPRYHEVQAPALALYEPGLVRSTYPNYDAFDADNRARADKNVAALRPWREQSMAQFRRDVRHGRVIVLSSGNHYIFLTNEAEVVRLMRQFLDEALEKEPRQQ
ncbi:MAG TPA: alpha/beta fold hydrolase [Vicinamibacterales bacterium]|nr:alpha/beta fold hydrolase [Vicinamibacterales bacterium]